jgi:hypothetical protein
LTPAALVFLTPVAAVIAVAVLLPLAAFFVAEQRVATVRRVLTLQPPRGGVDIPVLAALGAVVLLLALVAAQPAVSSSKTQRVRTDAEVVFVLDISQSMAASGRAGGATRLERASSAAIRLRSALASVPSGVATLTDRVLPNLLPAPDPATFDATVRQTLAINQPPPREQAVRATTFGALAEVPGTGYFSPSAKHRVIVLLTDGESAPFDPGAITRGLAAKPRTQLLAVQFWQKDEAIYAASGLPNPNYRPDPTSKTQLAQLAASTHGRVFTEGNLGRAAAALHGMLDGGPTRSVGRTRTVRPLAPYIALAALLPLAFLFGTRSAGISRRTWSLRFTSR